MDDDALQVGKSVSIPRSELIVRFTTSGGPGGQHANRAETRVEISFDAEASEALSDSQRRRIVQRLGPTVTVTAGDQRSQVRNRRLAEQRLVDRLTEALRVQRKRRPTRRTRGSQERRLQAKRRRSGIKSNRRPPRRDD